MYSSGKRGGEACVGTQSDIAGWEDGQEEVTIPTIREFKNRKFIDHEFSQHYASD